MPVPWPLEAREAFVGLLAAGPPAVAVVEALDHAGILMKLLPDWGHVRSRPQHNPYHRFTVDRHLVEAAANAAALTRTVARPDLLLVGTLLHDIGKGLPGDHSVVGAEVAERIGTSMGFDASDVAALVTIARHHLLLPDTATRRDLEDPATAEFVASEVSDPEVIDLLAAVAEADGRATGPTAWSPWKAQLVAELARRVKAELAGATGAPADRDRARQLSPEQERLLAAQPRAHGDDRAGRARRGRRRDGAGSGGSAGRRDRSGGVAPARRAACVRGRLRASGADRTLGAAAARRRAAATGAARR